MNRTSKLIDDGYKIFDTCYEFADDVIEKAKRQGYVDIKVRRTKTDTKGLKCFVVWVKK